MSAPTEIEWTDFTWNPTSGCTKVSPGCDHCYAETIANRFAGTRAYPNGFDVTFKADRLTDPLRKRSWRGKRVFVNSMSDMFHDDVPDDFIAQVFAVMALAPEVTFQLLTKRHGRMRSLLASEGFRQEVANAASYLRDEPPLPPHPTFDSVWASWPLRNVWLGVSVEDQKWADLRIPALLDTPAAVRWLSCEPLIGPISFRWARWVVPLASNPGKQTGDLDGLKGIDWVVVGGESGPGARPMHPHWPRLLRDQCVEAGVPFFFKQWGEWSPDPNVKPEPDAMVLLDGRPITAAQEVWLAETIGATPMARVGKKRAGRLLDGRTWDQMPAVTR